MQPNYTAKKSALSAISIWHILFFWLIIPLIVMAVKMIIAKNYSLEFYDEKVVVKSGVLSKSEKQHALLKIMSVSIFQSLGGRLFDFGNVEIDFMGRGWDVDTNGIKDPQGLKRYLENKISKADVQSFITN